MLKGLVITMGGLIVIAMGALAYGLYHKAANPDFRLFAGGVDKAAGFGEVRIPGSAGCAIAASEARDGRLFVRLATPPGAQPRSACERVVVLDAASGAVLGSVGVEGAQ